MSLREHFGQLKGIDDQSRGFDSNWDMAVTKRRRNRCD